MLLLGAVAQGVAGLSTNPLDALKTRVQAGGAADVGTLTLTFTLTLTLTLTST